MLRSVPPIGGMHRRMAGRPRYFQIGFHRCGTTSLWRFFERNGIPTVHFDKGNLARRMRDNIEAGGP